MFHQKLLTGQSPFQANFGTAASFPLHRHSDIELSFCLHGSYTIIIEGEAHTLREGELAFILPMESHEYIVDDATQSKCLTLVFGPSFLGEYYKTFIQFAFHTIYSLKALGKQNAHIGRILSLLEDICALRESATEFSGLQIQANLYQICALILEHLPVQQSKKTHAKNLQDLTKIERALQIIQQAYAEPLSIDTVSRMCGYSKSNFCTIFKNITGATFHSILNQHRIDIACLHLQNSDLTIEDIAERVGFTDAKSFCRVFKKTTGTNAGEYRKSHRKNA